MAEPGLSRLRETGKGPLLTSKAIHSHLGLFRATIATSETQSCHIQQRHGTRALPCNMKPATEHRQCMETSLPQNTGKSGNLSLS
jgi:hypothetical protein